MMFLFRFSKQFNIPSVIAVRYRKIPKRKPTWLPVAPSKVFRLPEHPFVPPDEKQLVENLLEEYTIKMDSIRKVIQEEMRQAAESEENVKKLKEEEMEEFRLLLAENKKENERLRLIREKTLEKEFQEKLLHFSQMAEEKMLEISKRKLEIEEIVRKEKEKVANYITLENIDTVIEKAIDNPVNYGFCLSVDGKVTWEGKPSTEYEHEIQRRIATTLES